MGDLHAPRRIHGIMHEFRKRRKRDENLAREAERIKAMRALNANKTEDGEILVEEKPKVKLRELRLWETTLGETMRLIHQYKVLHPEVFEEEKRDREDALGEWKVQATLVVTQKDMDIHVLSVV